MPWFAHRSIGLKLPLGIAVLLAVACAGVTTAAYLRVRASAFEAASERLVAAARQIEGVVAGSMRTRVAALETVAADRRLRRLLSGPPDDRLEADVRDLLDRQVSSSARSSLRLHDRVGDVRLTVSGGREPAPAEPDVPLDVPSPVGPFVAAEAGEGVSYELAVLVGPAEAPVGHLVERRWLAATSSTMDLLQGLIGEDARLLVGNEAGDVWTDFTAPVEPLPAGVADGLVTVSSPGGEPIVARGVPVNGTPWTLAVALPLEPVIAPVRQFLIEALAFTGAIVVLGALAGWAFSRRITAPLQQLTESAEAVAAAGGPHTPTLRTGDEVTRLAGAFAAMTTRVDESHQQLETLVGQLEDRVRARTAELETANRELEAFSYSVSHDLRAPIRAIAGFGQILEEDYGPSLPAEARRHVDVIVRRSRQMGDLIDDLLALSRVGRLSLSLEPVDMARLTAEVADELQLAANGPLSIEVGDLPPAVGEPSLVRQVLINLLQNARKFSAQRDDPRVQVGAFERDGEHVYFVRDNGVGFDMQYASKLFGVFQRLHRPEAFEGTGVGLAIVHRIVERHGGRIWAEAVVDGGATFYFTLAPAGRTPP